MVYKNKKSRKAIPGYTLIPKGDHYQVRKIGVDGERVKKDPVYKLTRLCAGEFGLAAKLGKLIRSALLPGTGIKNSAGRLTGELLKSLGADEETLIGDRDFSTAQFHNMAGFNFNGQTALHQSMNMQITTEVDAGRGQVTVNMPPFTPAHSITAPEGITHCRIYTITVAVDLAQQDFERTIKRTTIIPIKEISVPSTKMIMEIAVMKNRLVIVAMGMQWYRQPKGAGKMELSTVAAPLAILQMANQ